MIISHEHKFIFVKTRKTASSSLEKLLSNYLGKNDILTGSINDKTPTMNISTSVNPHVPVKWIKNHYPQSFKEYYKFTVVRNPWDYLVSLYTFHTSTKIDIKLFQGSFNEWISTTNLKKWNDWNKFTIDNTIVVDKIFKYENLHNELLTQTFVPYNGELLHINVKGNYRKDKDYRSYYNSNSIKLVEKSFKNIIDKFDYTF